jgi:hypothetical protein
MADSSASNAAGDELLLLSAVRSLNVSIGTYNSAWDSTACHSTVQYGNYCGSLRTQLACQPAAIDVLDKCSNVHTYTASAILKSPFDWLVVGLDACSLSIMQRVLPLLLLLGCW